MRVCKRRSGRGRFRADILSRYLSWEGSDETVKKNDDSQYRLASLRKIEVLFGACSLSRAALGSRPGVVRPSGSLMVRLGRKIAGNELCLVVRLESV
jgi:hypothetical protein